MKLSVPYYSQFVDVADPFWMLRACGAICLKSILEFHGKEVPDIVTFSNAMKEKGAYDMVNGWIHDGLVEQAKEIGLVAYRKEGLVTLTEIFASLDDDCPVIVSVEKRVLEQARFHLVTLVGYEKSTVDGSQKIYYHESESTVKEKGMYRECDAKTLLEYWRGKAIFLRKEE